MTMGEMEGVLVVASAAAAAFAAESFLASSRMRVVGG